VRPADRRDGKVEFPRSSGTVVIRIVRFPGGDIALLRSGIGQPHPDIMDLRGDHADAIPTAQAGFQGKRGGGCLGIGKDADHRRGQMFGSHGDTRFNRVMRGGLGAANAAC